MKLNLSILILLVVLGCAAQPFTGSEIDTCHCEISSMVEYDSVFLFETITDKGDSLSIVSRKVNSNFDQLMGEKKTIQIGKTYSFKLSYPKRLRVGQMEQLGYHFIINSDTIWSGTKMSGSPRYSLNSQGLIIVE